MVEAPEPGRTPGRALYLHLLALGALAFARPLLELLAGTADFYAARGGGRADVLFTVALASLVAPLPWLGAAALARWRWPDRRGERVVAALVGSLVGLVALRALALGRAAPATAIAVAVAVGAAAGWAYLRTRAAHWFASCLVPAVVVVPALFLIDPWIARQLEPPPRAIPLHQSGARVPVVVIVLDELSLPSILADDGTIDARFPHLAALAGQSTWFRNAVAPSWETISAVPAILSGRIALSRDRLQRERNLFTLLGDYPAYTIQAFATLCPPGHNRLAGEEPPAVSERLRRLAADLPLVWLELVTPYSWRLHLPTLSGRWDRFAAADADAARPARRPRKVGMLGRIPARDKFLAGIAPAPRALYVAHLVYPHTPWEYLPSGRKYPCRPDCLLAEVDREPWRVAHHYQRYLLQLGYTDRLVGDIVARLRAAGLYDRALVVLVADHGLGFQPGVLVRSTRDDGNLGELLNVPLLIKQPGQTTARVDDAWVTTADLLATVADLLAVRPPWPIPGSSLFGPTHRAPVYLDTEGNFRPAPRDIEARRAAARERLRQWTGTADDGANGPWPRLLGTAARADGEAAGLSITLDRPELFRDVDPQAPEVPVLVTGRLAGEAAKGDCCALALALDGTIVATTHSYLTSAGERRVSVLIPERSLRRGNIDLTFYAVDADGSRLAHVKQEH